MSMSDVLKKLSEISGRKPSDADIQRIHAVAHALNVSEYDEYLAIIACLDHYFSLYKEMPDKIVDATNQVAAAAREVAESQLASMAAATQKDLAASVNKAAAKSAAAASTRTMISWIASAIVICCIAVCGVAYAAYNMGRTSGWEAGVTSARNEELLLQQRDEFTKTNAFTLAHSAYERGELVEILTCKKRGWVIDNGICYPGYYEKNGNRYMDGFTAQ